MTDACAYSFIPCVFCTKPNSPVFFWSFFRQKSTGPESLAGHPGQEFLNFPKICFHFQGVSAWHGTAVAAYTA